MKKILKRIILIFLLLNFIYFSFRYYFDCPTLKIEAEIEKDTTIELYYSNGEEAFNDEKMLKYEFTKENNNITFKLPKENIEILRIDFSNEINSVEIRKIIYYDTPFLVWYFDLHNFTERITEFSNISQVKVDGEGNILFNTLGRDSYLIFKDYLKCAKRYFNFFIIIEEVLLVVIAIFLSHINIYISLIIKYLGIIIEKIKCILVRLIHLKKDIKKKIAYSILLGILFYLVSYYLCPIIEMELEISNPSSDVELYYSYAGESFNDNNMVKQSYKTDKRFMRFVLLSKFDTLRIDFSNEVTDVVLSRIIYHKNPLIVLEFTANDIKNCIYSADNITNIEKQNDALSFQTLGKDSRIVLRDFDNYTIHTNILFILKELLFTLMSFLIMLYWKNIFWSIKKFIIKSYKWICNKIDQKINITKKQAVVLAGIIYIVTICWFAIKYKGYFSFDEFYHISTLNPAYITSYDRANYINYAEKMICLLLGKDDFVVKLVPMLCGLLCFALCMYLAYNLYDNVYLIIMVACIISFTPYVLYNQFYIRIYIFLELIVMIDSVMFYLAARERSKKRYFYLLVAMGITCLYCSNTNDFTSTAMFLLIIVALSYNLFLNTLLKKLMDSPFLKQGIILTITFGSLLVLLVVLIKCSILDFKVLHEIVVIKTDNTNLASLLRNFYHSDDFAFLRFVFISNFYVIVPFIISAYIVLKEKEDNRKILYIMSGLPLAGYMILFYDSYQIRSYIAFWPIVCVLAFLCLDRYRIRKEICIISIVVYIFLTINMDKNFWESPQIPNETISMNLGEAVSCAREYEKEGYEIVTMMIYKTQSAYFDLLNVDTNLNIADLRENGIPESYIGEELDIILNSDKKYVILLDRNSKYYYNKYSGTVSATCQTFDFGGGASCVVIN